MPKEDKKKLLLVATTPSLGARLWIERDDSHTHDMVCLHVANEGGRGTARYVALLPVRRSSANRLEPVLNPSDFRDSRGDDRDMLWKQHLLTPPQKLPTPFSRRYSGDEWRAICRGEPWLLVVALFASPESTQPGKGVYVDDDIVAALERFFSQQPQAPHLLRRGLVYLAAADVPLSPTSPPIPASAPTLTARGPDPDPRPFTFALASCQYPAGLIDGTPQAFDQRQGAGQTMPPGPADTSMLRLAARLDEADDTRRPSLLVLTGDQIYADATAGLFDPRAGRVPAPRSSLRDAEDWLRVPYQNWYGSVGAQSVLGRLITLSMLDDHEIDNNWEPLAEPARPGAAERLRLLMAAGSLGYQRYQRDLRNARLLDHLWHRRQHRGIPFFMADTRTERGARQAGMDDPCAPRILGEWQFQHLLAWIDGHLNLPDDHSRPWPRPEQTAPEATRQRPAFIVSPAMLLPRRRSSQRSVRAALHSDAWDGYPGSLHQLLVQLWQIGRSNLVFLSGDEHLSCVVKATVTKLGVADRAVTLHSVHSSGLYSPYPFANAVPALFALPDDWTFNDPQAPDDLYRCVVEPCAVDAAGSPWAPGDGFALLTLTPPTASSGSGSGESSGSGSGLGLGLGLGLGSRANPASDADAEAADWQLEVRFDRAAPRADRCAQPPAPGTTTPPCTLRLAPGPGPWRVQSLPD